MLPPTSNPIEKTKQIEFFKFLIRETFMILDLDRKGYIDKKEVSYLMRYLLQFPSEA